MTSVMSRGYGSTHKSDGEGNEQTKRSRVHLRTDLFQVQEFVLLRRFGSGYPAGDGPRASCAQW